MFGSNINASFKNTDLKVLGCLMGGYLTVSACIGIASATPWYLNLPVGNKNQALHTIDSVATGAILGIQSGLFIAGVMTYGALTEAASLVSTLTQAVSLASNFPVITAVGAAALYSIANK